MSVLGNFLDNDTLLSSFDGIGVDGTNGMGIWGRNLSIAANRINQRMSGNPDGISFYSTGFKYLGRKNNNCLGVNQDLYVTYETPSTTIHPAAQLVLQRHSWG